MDRIVTLNVDGKTITFNNQQVEALDNILAWLKSDKLYYTLAGVAGSGKSTCVKKVIELSRIRKDQICISAPTHKAKKVVSRMSGLDGKTMQSILGLRPDVLLEDFNPNYPIFNPIASPTIDEYLLIVIDEASMINKGLLNLIKSLNKDYKIKFLFMGDPIQIPPVGEADSMVFLDEDIEIFWLTEVMRQNDGNPLMPIYDSIRVNLDDYYSGFDRKTNMNDKGEGVTYLNDRLAFRKLIISMFTSDEFKENHEYVKVGAWTNDTVMKSNLLIRSAIFGDEVDIVEVNDILMGYRTISDQTMKFNIIENSCDYKVIEKSELEENSYGLKGYRLKLREDVTDMIKNYTRIFLIDISDYDNLHRYAEMHDQLKANAIQFKKLWKVYYKFRRETMTSVDISTFRGGIKRGKQDYIVKDLDYGYSLTIHKMQGSTYEHVMLLEDNIFENSLIEERNRILYTAMSRPRKSAIILSQRTIN